MGHFLRRRRSRHSGARPTGTTPDSDMETCIGARGLALIVKCNKVYNSSSNESPFLLCQKCSF